MHALAPLALIVVAAAAVAHPGHEMEEEAAGAQTSSGTHGTVSIVERDGYRYITSNGIPNHETGRFPNRNNPNAISAQRHSYRVTLTPRQRAEATSMRGVFGIAVNGVPMDPGTAEWWQNDPQRGWNYDALSGKIDLGVDDSNAHVQPTGTYHYHGIPTGLLEQLRAEQGADRMLLIGWAADGFPIYGPACHADAEDSESPLRDMQSSYRLKEGQRPASPDGPGGAHDGTFNADWEHVEGAGDLDECNGRFGVTPEFPEGTYYYVLTDEFPFIPRMFRGTPDESFVRRGPPPGRGNGPPGGRRPRRGR
ncbi:MAG: YHYH protein [Planctomycetota bacterium]